MAAPTEAQRTACAALTADLVDWIAGYESTIVERLGLEYRRSTLARWADGSRPITPAEDMAGAWQSLGVAIAGHFQAGRQGRPTSRPRRAGSRAATAAVVTGGDPSSPHR